MLSHVFSVIIERGISAPEHVIEVVDGLNSIEKRFLLQLMSTVQLPGEKVMTQRWLFTLESVHLMLFWPENFKNTCLVRHTNTE